MGDALPGRAATWMMLMTGVDIGVAGVMMMTGGDHARRTLPGPMVTEMTTSGDADAMMILIVGVAGWTTVAWSGGATAAALTIGGVASGGLRSSMRSTWPMRGPRGPG
jgi:hypothetical protein